MCLFFTLGDSVAWYSFAIDSSGISLILLRVFTICNRVLHVGSSTYSVGTLVNRDSARIITMSEAACLRWSVNNTLRNGTL